MHQKHHQSSLIEGSCSWSNSSGIIDECQAEGKLRHGYRFGAQEATSTGRKSPSSSLSSSQSQSSCPVTTVASVIMVGLHHCGWLAATAAGPERELLLSHIMSCRAHARACATPERHSIATFRATFARQLQSRARRPAFLRQRSG